MQSAKRPTCDIDYNILPAIISVTIIAVLLLHSGLEPGSLGLNLWLSFLLSVSLRAKDWPPESQ